MDASEIGSEDGRGIELAQNPIHLPSSISAVLERRVLLSDTVVS
jgi:hypothetical protein